MRHDNDFSGSPEDWLRYARSDLELAHVELPPNAMLEGLCFHAQQAVEKAIKSVLVFLGIPFPQSHNISTLLELLPIDFSIPEVVQNSTILIDYAVITRYPGVYEPVEEQEYQEAVYLAEAVFDWAKEVVHSGDH